MKISLNTLSVLVLFAAHILTGCGSSEQTGEGSAKPIAIAPPSTSDQTNLNTTVEEIVVGGEAYNREIKACNGSNIVCIVSVIARANAAAGSSAHNSPAHMVHDFEKFHRISCIEGQCTTQPTILRRSL